MSQKCEKKVSDHTGYSWWSCGKPAKSWVWLPNRPSPFAMCGVHTNQAKRRKDGVRVALITLESAR